MFDNYEELKCDICKKTFEGRRPAEGGDILCPECIFKDELVVVGESEDIPESVLKEKGGEYDGD